jgi:hypothetical protein
MMTKQRLPLVLLKTYVRALRERMEQESIEDVFPEAAETRLYTVSTARYTSVHQNASPASTLCERESGSIGPEPRLQQ